MNELVFLILGLWMLSLGSLLGYRLSQKTSPALLQIVLGALVTLRVWGLPVAPSAGVPLHLPGIEAAPLLAPRLIVPTVFLIVLCTYILDGEHAAAGSLLSVAAVALVIGMGLPLLLAAGDRVRQVLGLAATPILASGTVRAQIVKSLALVVGLTIELSVYYLLMARIGIGRRWAAGGLSLLLAGWSEGLLSAFAAQLGGGDLASAIAGQWLGWLVAAVALVPLLALVLRRSEPVGVDPVEGTRRLGEVWRAAFDVRLALQRSEGRVQALNRRLRLLTGIRREIVRSDDLHDLVQRVCRKLVGSDQFDACWVGLVNRDHDGLEAVAREGGRLHAGRADQEVWRRMVELDDAGVAGAHQDESVLKHWIESHPVHQAALAGQPAHWGFYSLWADGGLLGALVVYGQAGADELESGAMLQGVAEDLALGINRLALQDQRELRVQELNAVRELMAELIAEHSIPGVMQLVVGRSVGLLRSDRGEIRLQRSADAAVERVVSAGWDDASGDQPAPADPNAPSATAGHGSVVPHGKAGGPTNHATIAAPLRWQGREAGSIIIYRDRGGPFRRRHLELLELIAQQASIALENAHLIEQERRRSSHLETLRQASLSLTSSLELQTVLESILEQALKVLSAYDAHIFLYDGEQLHFGAALWAGGVQREPYSEPREDGLTATVAQTGERIVVDNAGDHPLFQDAKWDWDGAIIGMPLQVGGRVLGVMNVAFDRPRAFTEEEIDILGLLADQAAIAVENARWYENTAAERRRLSLLYEVTRELSGQLDPGLILQRAIEITTVDLGGLIGAVSLVDGEQEHMRLVALAGLPVARIEAINQAVDMRVGAGIIGWSAKSGQAVALADVREDSRWLPVPGLDDDVRSAVVAPVSSGGRVEAVLSVFHQDVGVFDNEHVELLNTLARQVGVAWSNALRYQEVNRRLAERTALQQVAQVINGRLEMEPLLEEIVHQVSSVLGYPVVDITLVEGDELVMHARQGPSEFDLVRMPLGRGVIGRVVRTGEPAFVPDVRLDPDYVADEIGSTCEITVPLHKGGVIVGALNVESPEAGALTEDDLRLLTLLADQLSVAIENAALYDRLRQHTEDLEAVVAERTAELREALSKAREADRLKTEFVSDVSHELRTPLSNIRLYVELLGGAERSRWKDYLATLGRETDRLVELIEDLLSISRLDADSIPTHFEELDINQLAQALVEDRRRLFSERGLELEWVPSGRPALVWADERLLSQVIANLMTNAMHYTPAGGRVSVRVDDARAGDGMRLTVADTGLGIPDSELDKLFTRFFRGSASRKMGNPGTGLGLAICQEVIDRHHGRIYVDSEEGVGSRFQVWLPPIGQRQPAAVGEPEAGSV
jgi:GAF domain-containing protein